MDPKFGQYKFPDNDFGFNEIWCGKHVADDPGRHISLHMGLERGIHIYEDCVIDYTIGNKKTLDVDICTIINSSPNESFIKDTVEITKKDINYYKFPENELGFCIIGISNIGIYLIHCSGEYLYISKDIYIISSAEIQDYKKNFLDAKNNSLYKRMLDGEAEAFDEYLMNIIKLLNN